MVGKKILGIRSWVLGRPTRWSAIYDAGVETGEAVGRWSRLENR